MSLPAPNPKEFDSHLEAFLARAKRLEEEGVPFPIVPIREQVDRAVAAHDLVRAAYALDRANRLLDGTALLWAPAKEAIAKAEVLRTTAEELGLGVAYLDANVGNPRAFVQAGPLSSDLFVQATKMAETAIGLLRKAIPELCQAEARKLGALIQTANRRGEDVTAATSAFRLLVAAIRAEPSPILVQRLAATRRELTKIPSAPAVAFPDIDDAEEILLEARILARRINRIKRNARDAQSAARLMTHVRAALSEDRRAATPQEEIEELWGEVTRLTREQSAEPRAPAVPMPNRPPPIRTGSATSLVPIPLPDQPAGNAPDDGRSRRRANR